MLLHEITLRNLLSFGPDTRPLPLQPLNVLIGPNGSGKSNLIEAVSLLRSAPSDLATPVRKGGGVQDWLWKGKRQSVASVEAVIELPKKQKRLRHSIAFTETAQRFELVQERIEDAEPKADSSRPSSYYRFQNGHPVITARGKERELRHEKTIFDESILSRRKDPDQYPEITYLGQCYGQVRIYRDWAFGMGAVPRHPQKADQPNDQLNEDFANLGLVLNRLRKDAKAKKSILENLQQLYGSIEDYDVSVEGGTVQVFFQESGFTIPATRLSDGTLRYLCLLAILCHPEPPPLLCIEEPELGLHPDILPAIARLMKEASEKTQLIVTTHSDLLVDELTDRPDAVIVCEKHEGGTVISRLDAEALGKWLDRYRLGQLWTKGEIGGTRW